MTFTGHTNLVLCGGFYFFSLSLKNLDIEAEGSHLKLQFHQVKQNFKKLKSSVKDHYC